MKLAVNYSPQAVSLLSQQHIGVDRLKCPPWPELIAQAQASRPAYVHFGFDAGCGSLADTAWGVVEQLLRETDTPYINVHLQTSTSISRPEPNTLVPSLPTAVSRRIYKR